MKIVSMALILCFFFSEFSIAQEGFSQNYDQLDQKDRHSLENYLERKKDSFKEKVHIQIGQNCHVEGGLSYLDTLISEVEGKHLGVSRVHFYHEYLKFLLEYKLFPALQGDQNAIEIIDTMTKKEGIHLYDGGQTEHVLELATNVPLHILNLQYNTVSLEDNNLGVYEHEMSKYIFEQIYDADGIGVSLRLKLSGLFDEIIRKVTKSIAPKVDVGIMFSLFKISSSKHIGEAILRYNQVELIKKLEKLLVDENQFKELNYGILSETNYNDFINNLKRLISNVHSFNKKLVKFKETVISPGLEDLRERIIKKSNQELLSKADPIYRSNPHKIMKLNATILKLTTQNEILNHLRQMGNPQFRTLGKHFVFSVRIPNGVFMWHPDYPGHVIGELSQDVYDENFKIGHVLSSKDVIIDESGKNLQFLVSKNSWGEKQGVGGHYFIHNTFFSRIYKLITFNYKKRFTLRSWNASKDICEYKFL